MKRKLLFSILGSALCLSVSAQNLITDSDFENYSGMVFESLVIKNDAAEGRWSNFKTADETNNFAATAIQDASRGTVANLTATAAGSWYKHFLGQRLSTATTPAMKAYRLSFYAKAAAANSKLSTQIISLVGTSERFISKLGFDPSATPTISGATYDLVLTTDWKLYEVEFDFAKTCSSINSNPTMAVTTATDLENLKVTFNGYRGPTFPYDIQLDDVRLEEIKINTTIQNGSFEDDSYLPVAPSATTDPTVGGHSGQWVLANKKPANNIASLSTTSTDAKTGTKSMMLDIAAYSLGANGYPRNNLYLAMDIMDVPAKTYEFKLAAKASKDAPFRIDAYAYVGADVIAIYSDPEGIETQKIMTTAEISATGHGLVVYQAKNTEWTDYTREITVPANTSALRLFIRPSVSSVGQPQPVAADAPVTFYFDDFSFAEKNLTNIIDTENNDNIKVFAKGTELHIVGVESGVASIYSIDGKMVQTININGDTSYDLNSGIYVVKVQTAELTKTVKTIVE